MIDDKKIKSAAQGYCDATYGTLDEHPLIAEAFKQGAKWAIDEFLKDLWHPRSMDVYITKLRKHFVKDTRIELLNVHGKCFKFIILED